MLAALFPLAGRGVPLGSMAGARVAGATLWCVPATRMASVLLTRPLGRSVAATVAPCTAALGTAAAEPLLLAHDYKFVEVDSAVLIEVGLVEHGLDSIPWQRT